MENMEDAIRQWKSDMTVNAVVPKNVVIETIFGCNASCTMCPIDMPTDRKKGIMSNDLFERIIDGLAPYHEMIEQLDVFGVGEPLLVKDIAEKVEYGKDKGFVNVGFATNADLLSEEIAEKVFKAGLDTMMISIDGTTKEVHESIRRNVNFERIVHNVQMALAIRNRRDYKTKFVMRFIRQAINRHQWEDFKRFWTPLISKEKGDLVIGYDIHTWGGEIDVEEKPQYDPVPIDIPCHHVFDRLIILSDGTIPVCCADMHQANIPIGNCSNGLPIEIYNNSVIWKIRETHLNGRRTDMKICADCTILESEQAKEIE